MIKKYLLWSFFAVTIGFLLSFFLFEITILSASYVKDFFELNYHSTIDETSDQEEIAFINKKTTLEDFLITEEQIKENQLNKQIDINIDKPWGLIEGITMFRGNLTRTWYGTGYMPNIPKISWRYPNDKMCSSSTSLNKTSLWCGTGWTGQPVIWNNFNAQEEVIFGAYDKKVHFVNSKTGKETRKPFETGDIIKGSVTLDPDGFPLLYFGSRDNKLRILSLESEVPVELWSLDADELEGIWNNDWDGNPVIKDDILYEGGENGWFYAIKINRRINQNNEVEVDPEIIFSMPSYDKKLIDLVGRNNSIENSLSFFGERVYFANSGGRILGLDISNIKEGIAPIVFDFWVGDDVDSTIVIDENGMLYVSVELERFNNRSKEIGQFVKLNPYDLNNPYVWGIEVLNDNLSVGGIWATPALYKNYLYVPTHTGKFMVVNKDNGNIVWQDKIPIHSWSSPIIVNNELLIGTCDGHLNNYSLDYPESPYLKWTFALGSGSCIESTPIIWDGQIFVGSRDGYFYKVSETN